MAERYSPVDPSSYVDPHHASSYAHTQVMTNESKNKEV